MYDWKLAMKYCSTEEEGKLKGKLAEMVETMTENDNPILIIYKFHAKN